MPRGQTGERGEGGGAENRQTVTGAPSRRTASLPRKAAPAHRRPGDCLFTPGCQPDHRLPGPGVGAAQDSYGVRPSARSSHRLALGVARGRVRPGRRKRQIAESAPPATQGLRMGGGLGAPGTTSGYSRSPDVHEHAAIAAETSRHCVTPPSVTHVSGALA
jgi:hypothetical protein